jgi:FkbM family methyltransferase
VASESQPSVSILVAARNAERDLPILLAALERQTTEDFEVLLSDDASTDRTEAIAQASPLVDVESFDRHRGYPAALNAAARRARGQWLALTDADCRPADDWVERGLKAAADLGRDAILAGHIEMPLGPSPNLAMLVDAVSYLDQEQYAADGLAAGANLWSPRSLWQRLGGFSEDLGIYGGIDTDYCMRAGEIGCPLVYIPDAIVQHPPRKRVRDVVRKSFGLGRDTALLAERHHLKSVAAGWRAMLPQTKFEPTPRLRSQGIELSRARRAQLLAAIYLARHLPAVAGELKSAGIDRRLVHRARALLWQTRLRLRRRPITAHGVKVPIGPHLTQDLRMRLSAETYEADEAKAIAERLEPDDVVVELGGGLGLTSALCAQRISPSDVHVYEANPSMRGPIEGLYRVNHVAPDLHMYALAPTEGTMVLHLTEDFRASSAREPSAPITSTITVEVRDFEREIGGYKRRPNFLIVDIEGGEFDLLRAVPLNGFDKILCEVHGDVLGEERVRDLADHLRDQGFERDADVSTSEVWYLNRGPRR